MKKNKNIKHAKRALAVFFTVIASLFIVLNQEIQHTFQEKYVESSSKSQDSQEAPENNFSVTSSEAIVPMLHIGIAYACFFIFELSSLNDHRVKELIAAPIYLNDYYKTLFSNIISPNAP